MLTVPTLEETLQTLGESLKGLPEIVGLKGHVRWALFDEQGALKDLGWNHNLITDKGDQYYGERAAGIASPPNQVTGMRLGTGSTAPAKTGAGAAIVTYTTGSARAIDGGFPTSSQPGGAATARVITWQTTWPAGTVTANGLAEATVTNENPLTDSAGSASFCLARALLSPTVNTGASDSLVISWAHNLLGA